MTNNLEIILNNVDKCYEEHKAEVTHKGEVKEFLRQVYSEKMNHGRLTFEPRLPGSVELHFDYLGTTISVIFSDYWLFLVVKDGCTVTIERKSGYLTLKTKDGSYIHKDIVGDDLNELVIFFKSEKFNENYTI